MYFGTGDGVPADPTTETLTQGGQHVLLARHQQRREREQEPPNLALGRLGCSLRRIEETTAVW
jgi:hypothetical protein